MNNISSDQEEGGVGVSGRRTTKNSIRIIKVVACVKYFSLKNFSMFRLLDNVTKRFRKNKQRQEQQANIELDAQYG